MRFVWSGAGMQRAEIEGRVAAVSLPAALTVSRGGSKRAKLRAVLVEAVTADGESVHLLLTVSTAESMQLFPGQEAAFVVEEEVQCHARTLPLCGAVRQRAFCGLVGGASLPSALMTVEEFQAMWACFSEVEKLVWMDRPVSFTATVEAVRPWGAAQLAGGLCLFKPPSHLLAPGACHRIYDVLPVNLWNELQGFSFTARSNLTPGSAASTKPTEQQPQTVFAYHGYFLAWRHALVMCLKQFFARSVPSDQSAFVAEVQRLLVEEQELRVATNFVDAFCQPIYNALPERAYMDPEVASQRFPKVISVLEAVNALLREAEPEIGRLLSRRSPTDRRPDCFTLGVFRSARQCAVLATAEQHGGAHVLLRDDHAAVSVLGATLTQPRGGLQPVRPILICKDFEALIHLVPAVQGVKGCNEAMFVRKQLCGLLMDVQVIARTPELYGAATVSLLTGAATAEQQSVRAALQHLEPDVPRSILGIAVKKEIHAAYHSEEAGKFPPQLVVVLVDPEFWDTVYIYLPVDCVHRVLPGCVLQVTALKTYTRGDRFLYYKGTRASAVTVVRQLTNHEWEKSLDLYNTVVSDNPRTLDSHILRHATARSNTSTTILALRQLTGKATWSIRGVIVDVHFLLVAVKCSFCQAVCEKQSVGKSAARFSCSKCRLNGIRVRVSWEATLVVDDGTDEAKLSVDDEQLLQVLQMPARLKTKLENLALAGQDVRLDAQDFAQGAQNTQTNRRDAREQLRQHIRSRQKRQRLTMFVRLLRVKPAYDATVAEGVTSTQSAYNGTDVHTPTFKRDKVELQLLSASIAEATSRGYELLARLRERGT